MALIRHHLCDVYGGPVSALKHVRVGILGHINVLVSKFIDGQNRMVEAHLPWEYTYYTS